MEGSEAGNWFVNGGVGCSMFTANVVLGVAGHRYWDGMLLDMDGNSASP